MRYSLGRLRLQPTIHTARQCLQGRIRNYHEVKTPLEQLILNSIKATGPISVANYIQLCLAHPTHGYYMKGDPLGVSGDFITSPEISQVFGELAAIWFLSTLQSQTTGATSTPSKGVRLVELGPGRGTLMNDILRVFRGPLASSTPVKSVHLIETSPALREKQKTALSTYLESNISRSPPLDVQWHEQIEDVPEDSSVDTLVIANEFFDALPIHVFEKASDGWHEVLVDSNRHESIIQRPGAISKASSSSSPPSHRLRFVLSHSPVPIPAVSTNPRFAKVPNGTRIEYSRAAVNIMRKIGRLISPGESGEPGSTEKAASSSDPVRVVSGESGGGGGGGSNRGGMALLVDYGADHFFSSSLRGIRNHQIVDPFEEPGNSDLTSNVDFASLRDALVEFPKVFAHGPISQSDFLTRMGLEPRLAALLRAAKEEKRRKDMKEAGMKLVDMGPQGMGRKFAFMALTNTKEAPYPFS